MKRVVCFFVIFALATPWCISWTFAEDKTTNPEQRIVYIDSAQEDDITAIDENVILASNDRIYKTVYLDKVRKTVEGIAGNNPPEGTSFATGGGFYYSNKGGPTINGGISVTFPDTVVRWLTISVNAGVSSDSGVFVLAPRTDVYYKLYVKKTVEVSPYITYQRPRGAAHADEWTIYTIGHTQREVDITLSVLAYKDA